MGCSGCNCGPPDPMSGTRERWRSLLFLVALGGALFMLASR
jgi:MYXO-CTERM domain-containing protein